MRAKYEYLLNEYQKFIGRLLDLFGKWTPHVYGVFAAIAFFIIGTLLIAQFSSPLVSDGTTGGRYKIERETGSATQTSDVSQTLKKQRFLSSYEDSIPGNDTAWLEWAWVSAKNVCASLDNGESLLAIRSKFPQDQYVNNMKLISKDAILIVCPSHMAQLQLPANADTIAP